MIVQEINERFCRELWDKYPGDWERIHRMAIVADNHVKMAHLAIAGSYSINGVSKIHSDILKTLEMKEFYAAYPHKFNNKTNGVTHRRWLLNANPGLSGLITETIGPTWLKHPTELLRLRNYAGDASFREELARVKTDNKACLARLIKEKYDIKVDLNSIFDVQVKRLHAYKRQLLNVLHIMDLYNRLREDPDLDIMPRTFIFGAKASPSYRHAKTTIKLINTLASIVNHDKRINDKIKIVFLENYRVTLAEMIFPASDLSEQISCAGKEASGTGNMKFMMNGAVTIGTLDGANIEIAEAVGPENIFIFGLKANEVTNYYKNGGYSSWDVYYSEPRLKMAVDQLVNGFFPVAQEEFRLLYDELLHYNDTFFVLKDFVSYGETQLQVDHAYRDQHRWLTMSINNIAHSDKFSSDRPVREYADEIWKIKPQVITLSKKGKRNV